MRPQDVLTIQQQTRAERDVRLEIEEFIDLHVRAMAVDVPIDYNPDELEFLCRRLVREVLEAVPDRRPA